MGKETGGCNSIASTERPVSNDGAKQRVKRIGLIDVDGHNFPNIPLMKISAWHKSRGDIVEWYDPMIAAMTYASKCEFYYDIVYMSKIFSFTPDYEYCVISEVLHKGGSGYCIETVNGREIYHPERDLQLPPEIEHIYPDYHLYTKQVFVPDADDEDGTKGHYETVDRFPDTAYGFMSRGCPRGCDFCHVEAKEGKRAYKVADLSEFWNGQKNIVLLDPNPIACREWRDILQQLIDSGSWVDFSQGVDIRLMTEEKASMIKQIKTKNIHFAWDRYEDKDIILPKLKMFKELTGYDFRKLTVYMLCNFNTTFEQDLERVYTLRELGYNPFVMLYDKENIPKGHDLRKLQRWVNNRIVFNKCRKFEDFDSRK